MRECGIALMRCDEGKGESMKQLGAYLALSDPLVAWHCLVEKAFSVEDLLVLAWT